MPSHPWFVGSSRPVHAVLWSVLGRCVHGRVDGYALLAEGLQGAGFTSQKGSKEAKTVIYEQKGRLHRAIIGVFPANSIRRGKGGSRSWPAFSHPEREWQDIPGL